MLFSLRSLRLFIYCRPLIGPPMQPFSSTLSLYSSANPSLSNSQVLRPILPQCVYVFTVNVSVIYLLLVPFPALSTCLSVTPLLFLFSSHPHQSLLKLLGTTVDLGTSEHPRGTRGTPAACPASPCLTPGPAAPGCIKWRRRRRRRVAPWARAVPSMPGG